MRWPKSKQVGRKTPLEREYDRLGLFNDDPELCDLLADRVFNANELEVWRHPIRERNKLFESKVDRSYFRSAAEAKRVIKHRVGFGPLESSYPNPIVTAGLVITTTVSPPWVYALDLETGNREWSIALDYYGSGVWEAGDLVVAGTKRELLAIRPDSGEIVWRWHPYKKKESWLSASPTVYDGNIFVGSAGGHTCCVNAKSGELRWWAQSSRAYWRRVNSTPLVWQDRVVVSADPGWVIAYSIEDGREVWRTKTDHGSHNQVHQLGELAVVMTRRSIYAIEVESGAIRKKWYWQNFEVEDICVAEDTLLVVRRRDLGEGRPLWPVSEVLAFRGGELVFQRNCPRNSITKLRYEPQTGYIYESTQQGLGILDPVHGQRRAAIVNIGKSEGPPHDHTTLPAYAAGTLYMLNSDCDVLAVRHPEVDGQPAMVK